MATVNLDPTEYPSNSYSQKKELAVAEKKKKKKKPVVTSQVEIEKPSLGRKIKDAFIVEDIHVVIEEIVEEHILPSLRDGISDAITGFVDGLLYGSVGGRRRKKGSSRGEPSYAAYYKSDGRSKRRRPSYDLDDDDEVTDYRDYVLKTRAEAQEVLDDLLDYIDEDDEASIADYLDLIGQPSDPQDNHWGWTNLSRATVKKARRGYTISFPKAEYLE